MEYLKDIEPILSLISAVLSLTVIGFVIRLSLLMRAALTERAAAIDAQKGAVQEQKGVVEERLKFAEEILSKERERHEQVVTSLKEKLMKLHSEGGVTVQKIAENPGGIDIRSEVREAIEDTLQEIVKLERIADGSSVKTEDPERFLEIAKGLSVSGKPVEAAEFYDRYAEAVPDNWEVHFVRAVAYANSRKGDSTNLASLRAYNDAIAYMPQTLDRNTIARLYGYRGAMFKRLHRLHDAEKDLLFARDFATARYEVCDITYNLACVYAMLDEREKLLSELRVLAKDAKWRSAVKVRRVYFGDYLDDPEVQDVLA